MAGWLTIPISWSRVLLPSSGFTDFNSKSKLLWNRPACRNILRGSSPFFGGLAMAKQKSQVEKFREAAREAGTDESEGAFNATLKNLAKALPKTKEKGREDDKPKD